MTETFEVYYRNADKLVRGHKTKHRGKFMLADPDMSYAESRACAVSKTPDVQIAWIARRGFPDPVLAYAAGEKVPHPMQLVN